jgi:hypothetical protein
MAPIREYSPRSGTIPLQKINRTEPLRSHPALTVTLCSVHSATKQKTELLRSRLPNTEQNGSVPRIRDGTTPFYLLLNQTLPKVQVIHTLLPSPSVYPSLPRSSFLGQTDAHPRTHVPVLSQLASPEATRV